VLAWGGALALLTGCASGPASHWLSAPPPVVPDPLERTTMAGTPVTVASPAQEVTNPDFVMRLAALPEGRNTAPAPPPAGLAEIVPAPPSPRHVWLDGYWVWQDDGYAWMAGHWALPPKPDAVWTAPRWEQIGQVYRFFEGSWN
jgi:WXXGXW repeat (2 copies)